MPGEAYATVEDLSTLWRPLSAAEQNRAAALLPLVSDALRQKAVNVGQDLDARIAAGKTLANTAKIVTVGIVSRILRESTTGEPMISEMQTAGSYQWQGSYAIPGGGIVNAIMNSDLKALGLCGQKIGLLEFYGPPPSGGDSS